MSVEPDGPIDGVVTFLSTDIVGSTELWEQHPESMAAALECHDGIIAGLVAGHGGRLVRANEGDAVLAAFDRATSAAEAAWRLQEAMDAQSWPGALSLSVRVAVHTVEAQVGPGGYSGGTLQSVTRLRDLARGGQIVLSRATAQLVADRLPGGAQLSDIGVHEVSASRRVEHLFELRGPARTRPRPELTPLPVPPALRVIDRFAGRAAELDQLDAAWQQSLTGKPRTVLVSGEPGIGKTRLAAQVADHLVSTGAFALYGRCDEGLGVPYQPFVEALSPLVQVWSTDTVARLAGANAAELARLLPPLARLGPPPTRRGDPGSERLLLFDAVTQLLTTMSRERPLLLVLDDLQWATESTLVLLRHVLAAPTPAPFLVVAIYRNTELPRDHPLASPLTAFRRDTEVTRLALEGLADDEVAQLLSDANGELGEAVRSVASRLRRTTGGNPFFVHEVLRHLGDARTLPIDPDQLAIDPNGLDELDLPEGIRQVVSRRLSRLSDDCNRVLTIGAVAGPSFSLRLLERIPQLGLDEDSVVDALDEAIAGRVIVETEGQSGAYEFTHALVRQTVLSELSSTRRTRLHRRIAEAIESLAPAGTELEALAYHCTEAALDGQADKAVDYGRRAAAAAIGSLAYETGAALLERALLVSELREPLDHRVRAQLFCDLAEAHWRAGDSVRCKEAAQQAASEAERGGAADLAAMAAVLHTTATVWGDEDPVSPELCERALSHLAPQAGGLRSRVLSALSYYRAAADNQGLLAQVLAEEALDLAADVGDDGALADSLYAKGIALLGSHRVEQRHAVAAHLIELGTQRQHAEWRARGLRIRGVTALEQGDRPGFEADLHELERLGRDVGSWVWQSTAAEWRGMLALLEGRFQDVDGLAAKMLALARNDANFLNVWGGQVVVMKREMGEGHEVVGMIAAALREREQFAVYRTVFTALLADSGQHDQARDELERLAAFDFNMIPRDIGWPTALALLSDVCVTLDDRPKGAILYRHLLPHAGRLVVMAWGIACLGAADRYLGRLAALAGDLARADGHFVAAAELEASVGAEPALARTRHHHAEVLRRMGTAEASVRARELQTAADATAARLGMAL